MSVCKGKNKVTDYASIEARLEEEGEYDSLWSTAFGQQDFWCAPECDLMEVATKYIGEYIVGNRKIGNERKNQERSYTSSLRSRQASNNPVNYRKQKSSCTRYRSRR